MPQRFWVVSELYYPEETSTGYLLTRIAEGLARERPVGVICAQPTYSRRGSKAPARELRNGVEIERCPGTSFDKDNLVLRLLNAVTISGSIFVRSLRRFRSGERVLVVTNPPMLPFLVALACRIRGARCLLLIHDVYPEVLEATGIVRQGGLISRMVSRATERLYANVERIVVLGRDMERIAARRLRRMGLANAPPEARIAIIPNWADVGEIHPRPREENTLLRELGLEDRFVVQYAGNMGRTHGLETITAAAHELHEDIDVHFLFIGYGAKKRWLEAELRNRGLRNATVLPNQPRAEQERFLNACDLAIISFIPGMAGISVPSRMYNILAAGKPILAVTDADSELALLVEEEEVGWVVPPEQPEKLAAAVRAARSCPERLAEMSRRARRVAEGKYSFEVVSASYSRMLGELEAAGE